LTKDNKYVITSDRDEHIRVSQYPKGHNIESYCLGHTRYDWNPMALALRHVICCYNLHLIHTMDTTDLVLSQLLRSCREHLESIFCRERVMPPFACGNS
jgi:hypothetical protein